MRRNLRILVVDDDAVQRDSMAAWLREDGYTVESAASGEEAIELVNSHDYAVHFVDLRMPRGMDGIETMRRIREVHLDAAVVIVTAYATIETAITAIKEGAQEYLVKPCNPQDLSLLVDRTIRMRSLKRENLVLRRRLAKQHSFQDLTSKSPVMQEIFELIRNVASLRSTVLIQGESGTGKERVARALHTASDRRERPFVAVPCAALSESLLETELFGHERGAFTGAEEQRKGKFELADGGTLLLDEIGDISPKLQVELLRVLQERSFFRVGGSEEILVDVRVIAASNVNLQEAVRAGRFRDDLFYRLNVVAIHLPPLRERLEDIPLLARQFVESIGAELGKEIAGLSDAALRMLLHHDWPGNIRELENAIERAIVTQHGDRLDEEDFAFLLRQPHGSDGWDAPAHLTLREIEEQVIEAALKRTAGNVKAAAESLGIDRSTLYDKIRKYDIER